MDMMWRVNEADWPTALGVYILILRLETPLTFQAGRLGRVALTAGCYAYVGSARGPGGLRARLARHLRPQKRLHWHIDYLTQRAAVTKIHWQVADEPLECRWAQRLLRLPGASAPAPGFGSSDCRAGCPSHLIRLPHDLPDEMFHAILQGSPEQPQHSYGREARMAGK